MVSPLGENMSREISKKLGIFPPFETLFPLSFPAGYHEGKFFESFWLLDHMKHHPSNFSSWASRSAWEVSADFFLTGPHLYFTPAPSLTYNFLMAQQMLSNSWGNISSGAPAAPHKEVKKCLQEAYLSGPSWAYRRRSGKCPTGQPVPSELPELRPFRGGDSPAAFVSCGNSFEVSLWE